MISPISALNSASMNFNSSNTKPANFTHKNINCENNFELTNYKQARAILFRNNIAFKSVRQTSLKDATCEIELTSDKIKPQAVIKVEAKNNFPEQLGVRAVYMFAFNDQMIEQKDNVIKISDFKQNSEKRELDISFDIQNTKNALEVLEKEFLQTKLKEEHINMAKQIASAGLFLYRKAGDFKEEYKGTPENITEEEYEILIDKISTSDIEKYNQDFLKNSKINIKLRMNKNDYNQNQDVIYKYFDETKTGVSN